MADELLVDLPFLESPCHFPSLESLLDFSAASFLACFDADPNPDLHEFRSVFSRVLKKYPDPPLEAVWFFSALVFYDAPDDLGCILQLISAVTVSSPAAGKPLALLAPVVSELFDFAKAGKNIGPLLQNVLRCIRICCNRADVNADAGSLLPGFGELVKVWSVRKSMGDSSLQVLFPLVRDEARQELMKEGCSVSFLAAVVVAEALLLMLCLKVQGARAVPRSVLQKKLRNWASRSISFFKNQHFFGDLLSMLLNPPLPVYSPFSAEDELFVRVVLYDALILLHNSVVSGAEVDQSDSSHFTDLVSRLVITVDAINDAINDARHRGDNVRAMSYINTFSTSNNNFSTSNIPGHTGDHVRAMSDINLTSWAIHKAGTNQHGKPIEITIQAFLECLLYLEDKGLKVFGENFSKIKEKLLMHDEGKADNQSRISQSDAHLFFIDKQSRQEGMDTKGGQDEEAVEMETAGNAFMTAAYSMKVVASSARKRKDCGTEDATVVRFVK